MCIPVQQQQQRGVNSIGSHLGPMLLVETVSAALRQTNHVDEILVNQYLTGHQVANDAGAHAQLCGVDAHQHFKVDQGMHAVVHSLLEFMASSHVEWITASGHPVQHELAAHMSIRLCAFVQ